MRVHAYLVVADPTWLRSSVLAYYPHVERIVASYDADGIGWSGARVDAAGCLATLRELDVDHKIEFAAGTYSGGDLDPLVVETRQRSAALARAGAGADWVLQIDTDEVLPEWGALVQALEEAERCGLEAVEWPMRVLYRRLRGDTYLAVVDERDGLHVEYPGPIAVRPGVELVESRRTSQPVLRVCVEAGRASGMQLDAPPAPGEVRWSALEPEAVIWHNSWARSPVVVQRKVRSWGHADGWRSQRYFLARWLPAVLLWRSMRDFHPLVPALWPALRPEQLPAGLLDPADG
ncbi:hypothetical protein [Jatrophihabitans sp.]|uniref:hypothetical protein n=1 Tax=Jatrophihabitans sp. TaxID=1932789 RepID=UPI0030C77D41|nr:hypothetical protein [Jatrophihabitans sp.]